MSTRRLTLYSASGAKTIDSIGTVLLTRTAILLGFSAGARIPRIKHLPFLVSAIGDCHDCCLTRLSLQEQSSVCISAVAKDL